MSKLKILLTILLVAIITSCKKSFLEVVDKTVLLKQGYVVNLETTDHFMNGIYVDLGRYLADGSYLPYPEIMADNMKPRFPSFFPAAYNWKFQSVTASGFGDPLEIWQRYYRIIRNCSYVIEKSGEFRSENPSLADNLEGQARTVRAWIHFVLVNIFAQSYNFSAGASHPGVPYITSSDTRIPVSRQTVGEVYTAMIDDLSNALQLLPKTNLVKEKINYQAAKALLGRIYLFKEDYNSAKNISRQILNDVPLMTTDYPAKLYTLDETEALFRMPPGNSVDYSVTFIGQRGAFPQYYPTKDIAELLKADINDKRSVWVSFLSNNWIITKFPKSVTGTVSVPAGDYYQTLLRSTEMCLTVAEAYAKMNMEDSARFFIDEIRLRANPSLSNITATGPALLDSIYMERRKEMCFDGMRMWDLLRWKRGVNRIDATNPDVKTLPYPSDRAIAALPIEDVKLSGLPQNPGY